jgi:hypothetical protein
LLPAKADWIPFKYIMGANRFDLTGDRKIDFWHDIYGEGIADSPVELWPITYFSRSYQLGCRYTAQVLVTDEQEPPLVFLVDGGTRVEETPPVGAKWASSSRGFAFYFEEGMGRYLRPGEGDSYIESIFNAYGPAVDKPDGFAIGRYSAPDGWHYGWIQFSRAGTRRLPPGRLDITAWSFHTRPNLAIYAGESATPRLKAEVAGGQVTVSWSTHEGGFILESAGRITGAAWSGVPGVVQEDINYQVTLPLGPGQLYFRLRK